MQDHKRILEHLVRDAGEAEGGWKIEDKAPNKGDKNNLRGDKGEVLDRVLHQRDVGNISGF